MTPILRPAVRADAAALAPLHALSFAEPWSEPELAELLAGPGGFGLVAECEPGVPAGFLLARALAGEAEILTLAVDPGLRRNAVGSALVVAACAAARAAKAEALFLEVATDNVAAIALYEGRGFERAGFRPGYYRRGDGPAVDAFVLRRDLTA